MRALEIGHPEEVLEGVLCVAALLAAGANRAPLAGVFLGLAIANKPWAVLAAAPMVIVLPERRLLALSLSALVTISRDGASSWPCSPGRSTRGPAGP